MPTLPTTHAPYSLNRLSAAHWLVILLVVSTLIRIALILGGGELLYSDGPEYFRNASHVYKLFSTLNFEEAFRTPVFSHWGCILFATLAFFARPAFLTPVESLAIFFALPVIINILLIYRIANKLGYTPTAAFIASFLFAFSFSNIYQIKNVLPNDLAICFFLISIYIALSHENKAGRFFSCGFFSFLCFFTYYGYWTIALLGLAFPVIYNTTSLRNFASKAFFTACGFLFPLAGFFLIGYIVGADYLAHFITFGKTINMGSYAEGHSLPFLFLFHTEGPLFWFWLVALTIGIRHFRTYPLYYLYGGIVAIYLILVIGSNVLEMFVVYGRLVKAMVPLLCLLSAWLLVQIDRKLMIAILVVITAGFFYRYYELGRIELNTDAYKAERQARKNLTDNTRQIILTSRCIPQLDRCGQDLPLGCVSMDLFLMPENLAFFQYDGMTPEARRESRSYRYYLELRNCPKTTP